MYIGLDLFRQRSAGSMPASTGKLSAGVGCRHPVTVGSASLMGFVDEAHAIAAAAHRGAVFSSGVNKC